MCLHQKLDAYWQQCYMHYFDADAALKQSCIDRMREIAQYAETQQDASAEDLLTVGEYVKEVLGDLPYAYRFIRRSVVHRAAEMAAYCAEQYPNACRQYRSELPLDEAFAQMLFYSYFTFFPELDLESRLQMSSEDLTRLDEALFSFFVCAQKLDNACFVRNMEDEPVRDGYYRPISGVMPDIGDWFVSHSSDREKIIVCAEEILRARLLKSGMDTSDLTAAATDADMDLFCAVGEAYWQRPDRESKEKGFEYLWRGVKETGLLFPATDDWSVSFLKGLFAKAKELDVRDGERWASLAEEMRRSNDWARFPVYDERMIRECERRACSA